MKMMPTICTGTSGLKISGIGSLSDAEARIIGPVHGRNFTPAASDAAHARIRRSMPRRSYKRQHRGNGDQERHGAGPSRWISSASSVVPITIRVGRVPTVRRMRSMIGSSMPASVTTPKNRMANTNMPTTGARLCRP